MMRRLAPWLPTAALAAVALALNLWTLSLDRRWDLTSGGVYTMSPESRRVAAAIAVPVEVTYFYDVRSRAHGDAGALLQQFAAINPLIAVRGYDPVLQPAEARRFQMSFPGTAVFEADGRRVSISGLNETEFANALLRVTTQNAQRICFTEGHVESDPFSFKSHDHIDSAASPGHSHSMGGRPLELHERHGMGMARDALETLGYEVAKVLLLQGPDQLEGCAVVVVASPQEGFLPVETAQLVDYVAAGGQLVLLLEPFVAAGLEPVLSSFGILAEPHLVVDPASHYWIDPATPAVTTYARHRVTQNLPLTFFPGALSLNPLPAGVPGDVSIVPLAETSARDAVEAPEPAPERLAGRRARTLVLLATKRVAAGTAPRVFVAADGDFATNSFFHILGNGQLFLNAVNFLAGQTTLIDLPPRAYELPKVRLTSDQMWATFALSAVALPLALLLAGLAVWRRR
jgi:ABC-type uncharacterized transport system involved in gliding motility auxiliary subunit